MSSQSSNLVRRRHLLLNNPKETVPNTDGIKRLTISTFRQMVSSDEFKSVVKSINVSNVVYLCIEMDNAEDILRSILEVHPTLSKQLQEICGKDISGCHSDAYKPLECSSFKVFSDYEFPLVKKLEVSGLPDDPLKGLPNADIYLRKIVVNKNVCETVFNEMNRIIISNSKIEHIPDCEQMSFKRCEFIGFDEEHEQNGWANDVTESIGFEDCGGELPSITLKAVVSMSVDKDDHKELKLNKCVVPNIQECFLVNDESFDTSTISNVKKLSIRGDIPNIEPCVNLETLSVYGASTECLEHLKSIKTKDLIIQFDHDEDWYPSYTTEELATIDTSKLKSVSITGAEATGDIEPLKRKFEEAGVESCVITASIDILKKVKTSGIHVVNNVKNQAVGTLVAGSSHMSFVSN